LPLGHATLPLAAVGFWQPIDAGRPAQDD
jgi:hypothetical protein